MIIQSCSGATDAVPFKVYVLSEYCNKIREIDSTSCSTISNRYTDGRGIRRCGRIWNIAGNGKSYVNDPVIGRCLVHWLVEVQ